jgi:chromosome segregation ATPase
MTAYHHEIEALEQHLADFAELGQTAKEAFPEIEKNIEGITATYKEHVERATTGMQEAAGTHRDAIGRLLESMQTNQQELNRTLADGVSNTAERVEDTTKTFAERIEHSTDQLEESVKAQQRAITEMLETLQTHQKDTNQTVEQMVEQTSDNVANQIETLDEELGKELEKALKALGNQLASLSDKFVDDYGPLTDKLQRLVESSKRINGGHSS